MDVWMPVTMHDYMEQYGDKLESSAMYTIMHALDW